MQDCLLASILEACWDFNSLPLYQEAIYVCKKHPHCRIPKVVPTTMDGIKHDAKHAAITEPGSEDRQEWKEYFAKSSEIKEAGMKREPGADLEGLQDLLLRKRE